MHLRGGLFLKKIQNALIIVLFIVCVLSIFSYNESTTTHWTKIHKHVLAKLPDYLPDSFPFRASFLNRTSRNVSSTGGANETRSHSDDTTENKENYRSWFDNRTNVQPYTPIDGERPVVSDYIISNSRLCGDSEVDILIYFHSAVDNADRRLLLRETWASSKIFPNISIKTIFLLGKSNDPKTQFSIDLENVVYRDIVQGSFVDSFKNLTLKSAMAIHWINTHCIQARYIIKADDDMFVNMFKVVEDFIPVLSQRNNTVMCHFQPNGASMIVRNPQSKWYIPNTAFKGEKYFPNFCSGYVAIFTNDLIPLLYQACLRSPVIPVDDVYMFGLLPYADQFMDYIDIRQNLTLNKNLALKQYGSNEPLTYVGATAWDKGNMEKYWALTLNRLTPWAKRRAAITLLRDTMGPRTL